MTARHQPTADSATGESSPTSDGGTVAAEQPEGFEGSAGFDAPERRPTTASTVLALLVTVGTVVAFVWQVDGTVLPVALGGVGAVSYALSLWLVSSSGRESVTTTLASLLSLVVGGGLLSAVVAATVVAVSTVFPVTQRSLLSLGILVVVGHVGVVVGCVLAILGTTLGSRNLADGTTVANHSKTAGMTASVPAVTTVLLVVAAVATRAGLTHPATIAGQMLTATRTTLLAPGGPALHLGSLFLLVTLTAGTLRFAIGQLPVTELAADSDSRQETIDSARRLLGIVGFVGMVLIVVLGLPEFVLPAERVRAMLGISVYEGVRVVTTLAPLRILLGAVTAGSLFAIAISWVLRRAARASQGAIARRAGPIGTGVLVTVAAILGANQVYELLVATIAAQLPQGVRNIFTEIATQVGTLFGETTLVVLLVTVLGTGTMLAALAFRLALFFRYISRDTAGFSLASGGLFVGTVFAATIEAPLWLVLGGVVASLLVWDAGNFGTTLGNEIGVVPRTDRAELVHAGGTILVGGLGAGAAIGAMRLLDSIATSSASTATAALVFLASGIVFLVAALR